MISARGSTVRLKPIALSMLALTLAACGNSKSGSSSSSGTTDSYDNSTAVTVGPKTITIAPALGKVYNADVKVTSLDGKFTAMGNTSTTGTATFNLPASVDAIKIDVIGTATSTYFEEADLAERPYPAGITLSAATLVSSDGETFAVTPLTNAAVAYAMHHLGGLNKAWVIEANDFIADKFDFTDTYGNRLLTTPTAIGQLNDFANLDITTLRQKGAARHAIWLTAASQMARIRLGAGVPSPTLTFAQQLANDVQDGLLDGKLDGVATPIGAYASLKAGTVPNLQNAMKQALTDYVNAHLSRPATADELAANTLETTKPVIVNADVFSLMNNFVFTAFGVSNAVDPSIEPKDSTSNGSTGGTGTVLPSSNVGPATLTPYKGTYTGVALDGKTACSVRLDDATGTIAVTVGGSVSSSDVLNSEDTDMVYSQYNAAKVLTGVMIIASNGNAATTATYAAFETTVVNGVSTLGMSSAGQLVSDANGSHLGSACIINQTGQ